MAEDASSCFWALLKAVVALLAVIDSCGDEIELDALQGELLDLREELEELTA